MQTFIIITVSCLLGSWVLFLLAVMGRRRHPVKAKLQNCHYAHRGLFGGDLPENSMAAFRAAKEKGYGIELDVHLLADGTLGVMHDASLKRTTGEKGRMEELTAGQLKDYRLEGTEQTIPAFEEVLQLWQGYDKPMIVELKVEKGNYAPLTEAVCRLLDQYPGAYALESFDPRCLLWLRRHRPDMYRGQLTRNYFSCEDKLALPWILRFVMTHQLVNFLTLPDFVAYQAEDRYTLSNTIARRLWGMQGVTWTVQDQTQLDTVCAEGWLPIFEGFEP